MMKKNICKLKRISIVALTLFGLLFISTQVCGQSYDYPSMLKQIKNNQWTSSFKNNDTWVSSQNQDGSWSVFQYGKLSSSSQTSNNHLQRLWSIAYACTKLGNPKYNDSSYKNAIKNGLAYWYSSNTVDPNWWFNKIYFPQKLGEILILMREFSGFIPQNSTSGIDEPEILSLFYPKELVDISSHGTGANAVDIALHYIYRGILKEDSNLLEGTRDHLTPILLDNIKSDLCYQDHGPQLQISSYGWVYCNGLLKLAYYLSGSSAEFDTNDDNFSTFLKFIRDVQIPSIRGQYWDFSVNGRAVSRPNALRGGLSYLNFLKNSVDVTHASYYQDAQDRFSGIQPASYNVPQFNTHYWETDYTQHSRTNYLFTVRNVSTRVVECESGNGENLKAHYFSHGANLIAVDGDEYYNIMPVWDWAMIPGITSKHTSSFPYRKQWGFNYGSTDFVGGVSDGKYGATVLDLNKDGVKAKKSWFMFDDEVVCLGAGISDASGLNVRTTINQCWLKGDAYYTTSGNTTENSVSLSSQEFKPENLSWIRHGKTAYFFPKNGNIKFTLKNQSGSWNTVNSNQSSSPVSGDVFKLWIDHGNKPASADYSYVIVPNIKSKTAAQNYKLDDIQIISNTKSIQAVYHRGLDIYQFVFHKAASLSYESTRISVSRPCVVMLKSGTLLSVSDPTQKESLVRVTVEINGNNYANNITLPTGNDMEGSTVNTNLENVTTGINDLNLNMDFILYPNPTKGIVQFSMEDNDTFVYEIKDLLGRLVKTNQFAKNARMDISELPKGMYIITVKDDNKRIGTRKIIKN